MIQNENLMHHKRQRNPELRTPHSQSSSSHSKSQSSGAKVLPNNPAKENISDEHRDKNDTLIENDTAGQKKSSILSSIGEENFPLSFRGGGVYIPPFKMAKIIEEIREKNDKQSPEYQKMMWELLRKSINGITNKLNISNIQNIIYELFNENLLRGKGLLARAIIKAQMASPNLTHVFASLVAVLNTKLPDIGELILKRYILQFQKSFKRNNKIVCMATTKMLAHLINQQVNNETLAFEILFLFLENPTEDSVEMACDFMIECGQYLSEANAPLTHSIFERFRGILHEGEIDKRIQYTIENLFAVRKTNFKDHPAIAPELDLVADEDKLVHLVSLDDQLKGQEELDVFKLDPSFEEKESLWQSFKAEILGKPQPGMEGASSMAKENEEEEEGQEGEEQVEEKEQIIDYNETDVVKLRRTIYLTIISSVDFQECCHKLLKLNMKEGQEMELCNMIIECCIQERTYLRFYGLLAERFCLLKEAYKQNFEIQFESQYIKIHRLETNKLRNLAKLFAHLLYSNSIDWSVFKIVKLTEEDTTASSRIFCKIIFQELSEYLGLEKLNDKLQNEAYRESFLGLFCRDNPKNTRFCINFFTSIGLGALTQGLREFISNAEKMIEDQQFALQQERGEESESESSNNESDSKSSSEETEKLKLK